MRASQVATITRLYPFLSGATRIASSRFIDWASNHERGLAWAPVTGGELLISLDEFVGRTAFFIGDLDPKLSAILDLCIRCGDTVLDIGANIGLLTLKMARLVGSSGVVHAFEPNPSALNFLRQTLDRNSYRNVVLHGYALGDEEGQLTLHVPGKNEGSATLLDRGKGRAGKHHTVPVRRLDGENIDFSCVSFVKMDVEGFEPIVLKGFLQTLHRTPPAAIAFERNERGILGDLDNRAISLLRETGYTIYGLKKSLIRLRFTKPDEDTSTNASVHDFLAIARTERGNDLRQKLKL